MEEDDVNVWALKCFVQLFEGDVLSPEVVGLHHLNKEQTIVLLTALNLGWGGVGYSVNYWRLHLQGNLKLRVVRTTDQRNPAVPLNQK